jgi:signal peptidase I
VDRTGGGEAWVRYEHIVPDYRLWQQLSEVQQGKSPELLQAIAKMDRRQWPRQLITDANPYNGRVDRFHMYEPDSLAIAPWKQGIHWVGDLMLETDIQVESEAGELLLDLVEGGRHFTCAIDLASGMATLSAQGANDYAPQAKTSLVGPGEYHVAFANVDDQLLLWIDDDLVSFEGGTAYDVSKVFGNRREITPRTSDDDPGDLAPAGIGARGAKLAATRLKVWRDIYYIAVKAGPNSRRDIITDFADADRQSIQALAFDPSQWELFRSRSHKDFPLDKDQFFVMGDNSAESSDARLWCGESDGGGRPGGEYLERRLLIGKALCVYWPHSWSRIPGTPIPFPLFPNFADMRLVR